MSNWLGKILSRQNPTVPLGGYYAATTGSATGAGTIGDPWTLSVALSGGYPGGTVQPGDTIYLRGGTYTGEFSSTLSGSLGPGVDSATGKIHIKTYPGEQAKLDHNTGTSDGLRITGQYQWWWQIEMMNSHKAGVPDQNPPIGGTLNVVSGDGHKFIACIIHDGRLGVYAGESATNLEMNFCVDYYNGVGNTLEHGMYLQNVEPSLKKLIGNIVYRNFGYGIHCYGTAGRVRNYKHWYNLVRDSDASDLFFRRADGSVVPPGTGLGLLDVQYNHATSLACDNTNEINDGHTVQNNYIVGVVKINGFTASFTPTFQNNTIVGYSQTSKNTNDHSVTSDEPNTWVWINNTYFFNSGTASFKYDAAFHDWAGWLATGMDSGSTITSPGPPVSTDVFVYPSTYIAGRGHVYIYNWTSASTVSVDVSTILTNGDNYEIRYYQDYFTVVSSGTYGGGNLTFPMTGLTVQTPVAFSGSSTPSLTLPTFGAFVVAKV